MKLSMTRQEKSYNLLQVTAQVHVGLTVYIYNRYCKRPSKNYKVTLKNRGCFI